MKFKFSNKISTLIFVFILILLSVSLYLNIYLLLNISNRLTTSEENTSTYNIIGKTDEYELILIELPTNDSSAGYLRKGTSYYPIIEKKISDSFGGMYQFQSSDIIYKSGYIFEFIKPPFNRSVRITKLSPSTNSDQYFIASLVDIYNERMGIFNIDSYLEFKNINRCDTNYTNLNFDKLEKSQIEELILKGCMDYSVNMHSSPIEITFSNGKKVLVDDEGWFYGLVERCGEKCRFVKNSIE